MLRWRTGDPWWDLTDVVHEHDVVTAVTRNGTTHVLDRGAGTRQRVPVEGGHGLDGDFQSAASDRGRDGNPLWPGRCK